MKPSALGLLALMLLASCTTRRNPDVCCASDTECAQLGLPPGSANEYGCNQGFVCQEFYCVAETVPDAAVDAVDAPIDAPSGACNPNAPFGVPTKMPNVNSQFEELSMAMRYDQLEAYFVRSTGTVGLVIVTSKRVSVESDFPAPTPDPALAALTAVPGDELYLYPTSDNFVLYFRRDSTLFAAYRSEADGPFDAGITVYVNGTPLQPGRAMISADALTLYWSSVSVPLRAATHGGANNIFVNDRAATTFDLTDFAISADELTLYYSNYPNPDIFRTTRSSKGAPFSAGVPVANVSTTGPDIPLYVSPDDCFLYLRAGAVVSTQDNDIWFARRGF